MQKYFAKSYYLPIKITKDQKDYSVHALVDTGAVFTVIRRTVYEKFAPLHGLKPPSSMGITHLAGATGSPIKVHGVSDITVQLDAHTLLTTQVLVVDDLKEQCIIGLNTLVAHGISINFDPQPVVVYKNKSFPMSSKSFGFLNILSSLRPQPPSPVPYNVHKSQASDKSTHLLLTDEEILRKFNLNDCAATEPERRRIESILLSMRHVIARDDNDVGTTDIVHHEIHLTTRRPVRQPARRLSPAQAQTTSDLVNDMLANKIIEPSSSPYASPIVLAKKADGSTRFCVDYRNLNNITEKDAFPLPRIDDTLDALHGAKYFSTLDLQSGYWQVPVAEQDKPKTAFITPHGLYQFRRMPFGLTNAPATFQRLMYAVLQGLLYVKCLIYLDDIIIFGRTADEHATITAAGVLPSPTKIAVIRDWPTPASVKDVQSFVGFANYYRRFVPNFARVAAPLTTLAKKTTLFYWGKEQNDAFHALRALLATAPVLPYPDWSRPFILDTDASTYGLGAVLSQKETRQELLAIVWATEHFRPYLLHAPFTIRCDHQSLKWLHSFKNPRAQTARWIEHLTEYSYTFQHRPGAKHLNADALSRYHLSPSPAVNALHFTGSDDARNEWLEATRKDADLQEVIALLRQNAHHRQPKRREAKRIWSDKEHLFVENDLLYRRRDNRPSQIVVPSAFRDRLLLEAHATSVTGHFAAARTYENVSRKYFWPCMRQMVTDFCQRCTQCQRSKTKNCRFNGSPP